MLMKVKIWVMDYNVEDRQEDIMTDKYNSQGTLVVVLAVMVDHIMSENASVTRIITVKRNDLLVLQIVLCTLATEVVTADILVI